MNNTTIAHTAMIFSEDFELFGSSTTYGSQFFTQPAGPFDHTGMGQTLQEDYDTIHKQANPYAPSQQYPVAPLQVTDVSSLNQYHGQFGLSNNIVSSPPQSSQSSRSPSELSYSSEEVGNMYPQNTSSPASSNNDFLMYAPCPIQYQNIAVPENTSGMDNGYFQQPIYIGNSFTGDLGGPQAGSQSFAYSIYGGGNNTHQQQRQGQSSPLTPPLDSDTVSETTRPQKARKNKGRQATKTEKSGPKDGVQKKTQVKKARESQACDFCKDRKRKCDSLNGHDSSCKACKDLGIPCMQVADGRLVERGYLGRVESRLRDVEAQLEIYKAQFQSQCSLSRSSQNQGPMAQIAQPQAQEIQQPIYELAQSQQERVNGWIQQTPQYQQL